MLAPIQGELELACELLSPRHRGTFSLLPVPPGAIPWQVWESAVFDFLMFGVLLSGVFGFVPLPAMLLVAIVGITVAYVAATELQKKWFYRWAH